jgi:hypothetical protein
LARYRRDKKARRKRRAFCVYVLKRRAPQQARALMVLIRRFFNWVCDAHVYGLTASPCDRLSVSRIIGPVPRWTLAS